MRQFLFFAVSENNSYNELEDVEQESCKYLRIKN